MDIANRIMENKNLYAQTEAVRGQG